MSTQTYLVLWEILDQALVSVPVHRGERVVVHGDDAGRPRTVVDNLDLAEVFALVQPSYLHFLSLGVAHLHVAEALPDVEELVFLRVRLALLHNIAMRWKQFVTHSLDYGGQEVVHALVYELHLVTVEAEGVVPRLVFSSVRLGDNLTDRLCNRLILFSEDGREDLFLHRDAQRLRYLVKELVQLVLLGHGALHLEEVVPDLLLQLEAQLCVLHRRIHRV